MYTVLLEQKTASDFAAWVNIAFVLWWIHLKLIAINYTVLYCI